jgi:hypothetical protein
VDTETDMFYTKEELYRIIDGVLRANENGAKCTKREIDRIIDSVLIDPDPGGTLSTESDVYLIGRPIDEMAAPGVRKIEEETLMSKCVPRNISPCWDQSGLIGMPRQRDPGF